jgi:inhibitor of cysteine peptidase
MQKKWILVLLFLISITAAACTAAAPEPTQMPIPAQPDLTLPTPSVSGMVGERGQSAMVDQIDVLILESFPVQVNVRITGNLPDGCTYLDEFEDEQVENTFEITIWTVRDPEAMCTMALVPFEETVSLDVLGLEAGEYTVVVQEQSTTFTLDVDNSLEE